MRSPRALRETHRTPAKTEKYAKRSETPGQNRLPGRVVKSGTQNFKNRGTSPIFTGLEVETDLRKLCFDGLADGFTIGRLACQFCKSGLHDNAHVLH